MYNKDVLASFKLTSTWAKGPRYLMPSFGDNYGKLLEKLSRNLQRIFFLKFYNNMNDIMHFLSKWYIEIFLIKYEKHDCSKKVVWIHN